MRIRHIFVVLFLSSCHIVPGSGVIEFDDRGISGPFDQITVERGIELEVFTDASRSVVVEGDDNIIDDVEIVQSGRELRVRYDDKALYLPSREVVVSVTTPRIQRIEASGGSRVYVAPVRTPRLEIRASGGSKVEIERLTAESLEADLSSGSEVDVKGTAHDQDLRLSAGSQYRGFNLDTYRSSVDLSAGSSAKVSARHVLESDASGGSQVWYRGKPVLDSRTSGGAFVREGRD